MSQTPRSIASTSLTNARDADWTILKGVTLSACTREQISDIRARFGLPTKLSDSQAPDVDRWLTVLQFDMTCAQAKKWVGAPSDISFIRANVHSSNANVAPIVRLPFSPQLPSRTENISL